MKDTKPLPIRCLDTGMILRLKQRHIEAIIEINKELKKRGIKLME